MSAVKYWLWLSGLRGLRAKSRALLLEHFGSPEAVFFASKADCAEAGELSAQELEALSDKDPSQALRILDLCLAEGIGVVTVQDADYPARLRHIYDPPCVLFVRGRLPALDEEAAVALLGTRDATPYGLKMGKRLGYEITKCGGLVVSAMTAGVDRAGVEGALRAGGSCLGVLATPVNEAPSGLRGLYEDVAAVGALISECPPGVPAGKGAFIERNRITSGVGVGVVVVEAPEHSGTLLVAALASEQGRDVFAVPGNADSASSRGANALIRDGAKAVTGGWDIMCEYEGLFPRRVRRITGNAAVIPQEEAPEMPVKAEKAVDREPDADYIDLRKLTEGLSETQLLVVAAIDAPSKHIDDVIEAAGLPAAQVLSELTMLQIQGLVRQEPGKRFSLNITTKRGH